MCIRDSCSASASDPWKALDQKTDTTFHAGAGTTAGSFTWWKEVGASNLGLSLVTGTITAEANSSTVTGSSTTFTSDFAVGDMIRLGSTNDYAENSSAWYGYVDKVVSDTSLLVQGVVTKAFSSKFAYKQSFKPDFTKDTILSKVTRTASSSYLLEHFASIPGAAGTQGATGATGATGSAGSAGPQTVVSFVYHQSASSSQPSTPSADSYTFSNNTFTNLTSGWATTPPTFAAGNANKYWYSYYRAEENTPGGGTASGGSNLTFAASQQGIGFSGLVTFTGSGNTFSDGSTTVSPIQAADIGSSGSTTIDGGRITTGTISAARISISGKNISDLTNNSGFTNDDTANSANTAASNAQSTANTAVTNAATAQSTADGKTTASAAATAANSAAKTGGSVGGWSLSSTTITSGNITLDNANTRIVISD